jgi:hypothetical protein
MTRTDVMASSRPQRRVASTGERSLRKWRRLLAASVALMLAAALVSPGLALAETTTSKEGLSGYGKEEPKKETKKEEPKKEEAKKETVPSKETTTPTKETAPEPKASEPAKTTSTLPFTGLDLRLVVAVGILMIGAGFSIVVVQRRQRRR